ncbi:MAG: hydrolase [Pedobacter sp.]|nr:MAG: hydrolase [Pedobacter sp.]
MYAICRIAVAPLRADKSDRAEIVSQLLFGDHVEVVGKEDRWWLVENGYDGYQGWIDFKQLAPISEAQYQALSNCKDLAPLNFNNELTGPDGSIYHISAGSNLPFLKDGYCYAGEEQFKLSFEPHHTSKANFSSDLENTARFFLNTPYLWGGRNVFGIDCSGFVQTVFKYLGVKMRRDASQQAEHGELVAFLSEARAGDVAFFDNEEGKITHVGILLDARTIIHAAGKVKIDPIDDQGIFNKELNRYTHKLRIIKRFVE